MNRRLVYLLACIVLTVSCIPARPTGNAGRNTRPTGPSLLELPAVRQGEVITTHVGYATCFNSSLMLPNWVAYELTEEETRGTVRRPSNSPFQQDPAYKGKQPDRSDYSRSGWDKGHLMPCADSKWSEQVMLESFYFTNICPQSHNLNKYEWNNLEIKCREWARKYGAIDIVCGPLYDSPTLTRTIGRNRVWIPDGFFKVVMCRSKQQPKAIGFLFRNDGKKVSLESVVRTVDEIERITGIDFYPALDDDVENVIEAEADLSDW